MVINNTIWPMSVRSKFGRICKKCYNANDHICELTDKKNNTWKITCPECGFTKQHPHAVAVWKIKKGKIEINGKLYASAKEFLEGKQQKLKEWFESK